MRQVDVVTLARDDDLDVVIAAADRENRGSLELDEGDDALQRDLDELVHTPMYNRLWAPFWGHDFDRHAGAPGADVNPAAVLIALNATWKRLMEGDARVRVGSAKVTVDGDGEFVFAAESALTGDLVAVKL